MRNLSRLSRKKSLAWLQISSEITSFAMKCLQNTGYLSPLARLHVILCALMCGYSPFLVSQVCISELQQHLFNDLGIRFKFRNMGNYSISHSNSIHQIHKCALKKKENCEISTFPQINYIQLFQPVVFSTYVMEIGNKTAKTLLLKSIF